MIFEVQVELELEDQVELDELELEDEELDELELEVLYEELVSMPPSISMSMSLL